MKQFLFSLLASMFLSSCGGLLLVDSSLPRQTQERYASFSETQLDQLARQGDVTAAYTLGHQQCCGNDPKHNNPQGYKWLCLAAKENFSPAQFELAKIHQEGVNFSLSPYTLEPFIIPKDEAIAYMWYSLAAENHHQRAAHHKERLHDALSLSQLNRAIAARKLWMRTACEDFGKISTAFSGQSEAEPRETN